MLHIQHSVGQLKSMTTESFRYLSGNGQVELHEKWTEELPCLGLTKPFYIVETYVLQFFSECLPFNQNVDSASRHLLGYKQNSYMGSHVRILFAWILEVFPIKMLDLSQGERVPAKWQGPERG